MLNLINPHVLVAIMFAAIAAFGYGRHYEHLKQVAEIQRISSVMAEQANEASIKFKKQEQDAQTKINKLKSDLRTGAVRLSIPTSQACSTATGTTETRAELNGQTSEALVAITDDGDKAIRELNYCIDRYNQVKDAK